MEKKMENEMEAAGIQGFKELKLSYYIGETLIIYYIIPIRVT